ncbi:hypothetical protein FDG95_gp267 [Pectobacterium phage vB_PcaM_CBB]|uniref:Putative regulatory protein FmdB zinc ribbon domain-containing protein n=1 Tax=Pectobacterium phage vB_PcaM_CBB TaxID=2772511 RepID=A0A1L2CUY0_9CAUD|nr:hypothetical protein FDG95_gp267 [Pectobacterium phage vB_PcaM_CBB]AMM43831.1 hypothetical protein CBB_267 [Pectobacterium phage vB_PcaM_CBB]
MPLYTYRCTKEECNHSMDKIVKYDDRETIKYDCTECGTEQSMQFEAFTPGDKGFNVKYKGNWFNTTGRY